MKKKVDYTVYLVTDRKILGQRDLYTAVNEAVQGGVTLVQLREKDQSARLFYEEAMEMKKMLVTYQVSLIINDRVDIALAVDADGVHIGQSDLPVRVVRAMIGADKILGVSATTVQEALRAEQDGADYIGVGAMFPTPTKTDAIVVSIATLKEIRKAVQIPIVLIGGIGSESIKQFPGECFDGAAVVSDILGKKDIRKAAEKMYQAVERCRNSQQ